MIIHSTYKQSWPWLKSGGGCRNEEECRFYSICFEQWSLSTCRVSQNKKLWVQLQWLCWSEQSSHAVLTYTRWPALIWTRCICFMTWTRCHTVLTCTMWPCCIDLSKEHRLYGLNNVPKLCWSEQSSYSVIWTRCHAVWPEQSDMLCQLPQKEGSTATLSVHWYN